MVQGKFHLLNTATSSLSWVEPLSGLNAINDDSSVMKKNYLHSQRKDLKRRRKERYLIAVLLVVISFLTYLGIRVFNLGPELPFSSSILVFALININVILLLLLLFLTGRNLVKLFFERRKNIMGAKLRTKLVLAFVTLTLLPTIVLFFASVQFISSAIDYWSSLQIEQSLKNSLEVARTITIVLQRKSFFSVTN